MDGNEFSGVFVVMLTPFNGAAEINLKTVDRLVDFYCDSGVDGIFACGSAGEAPHLGFDQKAALMRRVAERSAGRTRVLSGVIASNTRDALALAAVAREAGCDGIVVTPPTYYTFQPPYVRQYFETVINSAGLPVILYNIPAYAQPLHPAMLGELAAHPAVVGVKDSSGSMVDFLHFMDQAGRTGRKLGFMTGREELLFASLAVGGSGSMSAINAIVPEVMVRIRDLFRRGALAEANALQMSLMELIRSMYAIQLPIGFREALSMRGFEMGRAVHDVPAGEAETTAAALDQVSENLSAVMEAFEMGRSDEG